jgi:hypothetical protein
MKRLAATLVAFQLLATAAEAQSSAPTPAVRSTLEILNSAKMPIVFDISCDQGRNWDAMTLAAGTSNVYYCNRETPPPALWFRIITQVPGQSRREVLGPLEWRSRSEIIWDESTDRWTLRRVNGP